MKMLPIPLSLSGPPLGLWSDVLWRYPPAPPSPLAELKTQLPPQLPPDPRLWGREDVTMFLRFCEREFDLPKFELDLFQMNGKALCLLTRADLGERCPGAGDVLHNVLQMLIRESQMLHRHLPSSPVTPTSRYPLSPHSHPPTPNWATLAPPDSPFHNAAHLHHFMQPNSVTLSPAPSIDSQASSPPQNQETSSSNNSTSSQNGGNSNNISNNIGNNNNNSNNNISNGHQNVFTQNNMTSSSSTPSDSDEESYPESNKTPIGAGGLSSGSSNGGFNSNNSSSPPTTPLLNDIKPNLSQQITNVVNSWSNSQKSLENGNNTVSSSSNHGNSLGNGIGGSASAPTTPSYMPVKREFFPESPEPNTNGRLLWDFLQQLLNDPAQRYSNYIAWKCRDTGVFKIVDPAGLARLWGIQKNHLSMNYDKMSRALRYYYRVNILRKVQGERHCYQFLRNPTELKNIKNISLLRQSVANSSSNSSSTSSVNSSTSTSSLNNSGMPTHNNTQSHQHHVQQQQQNQQSQHNQLTPPLSLSQLSSSAVASSASSTMSLSPSISSSAYGGHGQPPTSPLLMHAINGAFHYLSTSSQPHSPVLPQTPSEKLQFSRLKIENSNSQDAEDMKPTDLSVSSERRFNSNSGDGYPLIRNSDGLTTIKLIRYNENSPQHQQQNSTPRSSPHHMQSSTQISSSKSPDLPKSPSTICQDSHDMKNEDSLMATDLRK